MTAAETAASLGIKVTYGQPKPISIMGGRMLVWADGDRRVVRIDGVPEFGAFLTVARAEALIAALRATIGELQAAVAVAGL